MCFDTQGKSVEFEYLKINIYTSSRAFTRAGFESATVFSPLKLFFSLIMKDPSLSAVRYGDTNQTGLLLSI
jgi:hypothetical protein